MGNYGLDNSDYSPSPRLWSLGLFPCLFNAQSCSCTMWVVEYIVPLQLVMQVTELDSLNDEMQAELNEVRLWKPESQLGQVEELEKHYSRFCMLISLL